MGKRWAINDLTSHETTEDEITQSADRLLSELTHRLQRRDNNSKSRRILTKRQFETLRIGKRDQRLDTAAYERYLPPRNMVLL